MISVKLAQALSKDEILGLYLNQIYYGNGAYGAESAAHTYFSESAKDLTLPQSALLVCLAQRPSLLSSPVDLESIENRRNTVLMRLVQTKKISQEEYDK